MYGEICATASRAIRCGTLTLTLTLTLSLSLTPTLTLTLTLTISRNKVWDTLIILLIVVSSICLAIDSPRLTAAAASGSPFEVEVCWWLEKLNLYFTILFTFELMFKVV